MEPAPTTGDPFPVYAHLFLCCFQWQGQCLRLCHTHGHGGCPQPARVCSFCSQRSVWKFVLSQGRPVANGTGVRGYRRSRSLAPDWATPRCDLQSLRSSSRGFKQRHPRSAWEMAISKMSTECLHPVFCSVILSNAHCCLDTGPFSVHLDWAE